MAKIIGTAGAAKAVAKPARKVAVKKTAVPLKPDVQSSGGDYGTKKATVYKRTPQYQRTVRKVARTTATRQGAKAAAGGVQAVVRMPQEEGVGGALDAVAGTVGHAVDSIAPIVGKLTRAPLAVLTGGLTETPGIGKTIRKFGTNVLKDSVNLPVQAIPSTYHLADEAVHGHIGTVAHQLTQPYVQAIKDPGKAITDHPLGTALLALGPKAAGGRGLGRIMRLVPGPARDIASTVREPARVPGTDLAEPRSYSPDIVTKGRQVVVEKAKVRRATKLRAKANKVEEASVSQAADLRAKANRVDPTIMKARAIRRRVDERVAVNEDVRRAHRTQITKAVRKVVAPANESHGASALNTVSQNVTTASKTDMAAYVAQLEREYPTLGKAQQLANKQLRQHLGKAIADPRYHAGNVEVAARRYAELVRPLQEGLVKRGLIAKDRADVAALTPYAVRRMGATHDGQQLIDSAGHPLSADQIRAHMAAHNVSEPAFISQAPNARGAKNFYRASNEPPTITKAVRTGQATRHGTFDAHPDTLVEAAARAQGLNDAADGFQRFIGEFAHKDAGKVRTFANKRQADQAARDQSASGGTRFRAVRINPWAGSKAQLQALLEGVDAEGAASHKELLSSVESALEGKDGQGPWALIPEAAADQLHQHMRVLGASATGKVGGIINAAFRKTVLSTSPRWLTGNIAEAGLRSVVARAGPRSYLTGGKVLARASELDPALGEEARARTVGGGHFGMVERQQIHRDASQFVNTNLEGTAKALGAFWRAPGPRHLADVWHGWTEFVFHVVNQPAEQQFQTAMLGKAIRSSPLMDGRALKLSRDAIDQAARGMLNPETAAQLGREVDRMYGKYSKFSPRQRQIIALYTPFIAWTLNAIKFVGSVLPKDHPVMTSLLVSAEQATQEWRRTKGLDKFIKGALPDFLQGSIPEGGDTHLRVARYTPFGAFTNIGETLSGAVLPQYSGVMSALQGRDFAGRQLRGSSGQPATELDKAKAALVSFLEATIPVAGQADRIVSGTGPLGARLRGEFDPFKTTAPKKTVTRKSSSPWGGSSTGGSSGGWGVAPSAPSSGSSTSGGWG